jgi:uncharacterized membrane protein
METILIVLGLVVLAFPVFAVVALVKVYSLESKLRKLTRQFEERVVQGLTPQPAAQPAAASTAWQQTVSVPEPVVEEQAAIEPDPAPVEEEQATALPPPQTSPPVRNVEQALASRWLVWLGGAAIALGGLLLIKYAHDQGLVPPIVRVLVGWPQAPR